MSDFVVYPAIDLRSGKVVRLRQGDPGRQTLFSVDPISTAQRWVDEGATWLHVVNLDGAFDQKGLENWQALRGIVDHCNGRVNIQFGGGLRRIEDIVQALEAGVSRVVIGTAAIEEPEFAARVLQRFGGQVAFALDMAGGRLRTHGWRKETSQPGRDFANYLVELGAETVIYTDVIRDGMGVGVDWLVAKELAQETGLGVIASGGVASILDIRAVRDAALSGVIVGLALYEGNFTLREALAC